MQLLFAMGQHDTSRTCTIRDARPSDHAVIKVMNDGIQQAELDLVGYPMLTPDQLPPSYLENLLNRDPDEQGELLVCEMDGRVVGFLSGRKTIDDDTLVDPAFNTYALVTDLFVDRNYRSQGIGQALMAEFADRMRAKGLKWLHIWAKARNRKAIEAYLRFGFEPYEAGFVKPL